MNAQDFVKRLEGRRDRWGIGLASVYLRQLERAGGLKSFDVSGERWAQLVKEADGKLVYCDPSMVVESPVLAYDEGSDGYKWAAMPEAQPDGGVVYRAVPVVAKAKRTPTPGAVMEFDAIVTSKREDRDGDVLEPKGAEVDPRMPLLWQHFPDQPIGKLVAVLSKSKKNLRARFAIIDTPLGRDAAQLVEFGALRLSHGFLPKEWDERTKGDGDDEEFVGWHIQRYEMMEVSLVSVPSNVDAVITAYSRVGEKLCHPAVKEWAKGLYEGRPVMVRGGTPIQYGVLVGATSVDQSFTESAGLRFTSEPIGVGGAAPDPACCEQTPPPDVTEPACEAEPQSIQEVKGTVPPNPSGGGAGEGQDGEWSKPSLSDFTSEQWGDLSAGEKKRIAAHFAWYSDLEAFGSMKLPHHFPKSGKASLNGVRNALARAGQVDGIGDDLERVQAHLRGHLPKKAGDQVVRSAKREPVGVERLCRRLLGRV